MNIRPSPIAGRWYPAQAAALADSVDKFLNAAQVSPRPRTIGVIAPHAGHVYSGAVAGYAFAACRDLEIDTVVILSPSHFHDDAALITSAYDAYATPLGTVEVDRAAVEALQKELPDISWAAIRRDQEHAIEIELPFLQRVFARSFRLLPIMMRDQGEKVAQALGQALAKVLAGQKALLVGSSDLSHFYPDKIARQLDAEMLKQIDQFNPKGVLDTEMSGRGFACGHGAIAATLWAAQALGAAQAKVIKHATSGDVSGDIQSVVGYGAAVIWKEK